MANSDAFALQQSDLNGFLFADVGEEASGMTLSVISALARRGMDPWHEAGRLAKLPRTAAVDALAGIIAAMPASRWSLPDATAIAARLVPLLPPRAGASAEPGSTRPSLTTSTAPSAATSPAAPAATPRMGWRWTATSVLLAVALAALVLNLTGQ